MKTNILLLICIFFLVQTSQSQDYLKMIEDETFSVAEIIENAEHYFAEKDKGKGSGYIQFKRWEYNALRLMNEEGYLPSIEENIKELERYNAYLNETSQSRQSGTGNWEELGPQDWNATTSWNPGVGRITSIDGSGSFMIVGAETGGVWKTTDGGQSWTPLSDYFSNLYVYSVAIDPSNSSVYYFGSYSGLIYKSIDSGATWNFLGTAGNSRVNKIKIHPTNSNIMFATSENAGIYKSVNGGVNWSTAVTDSKGYDLEFKPGDPSVVYASGNGFHVSTNGGTSFTTIGGFGIYAKMIGVSADDASVVYVLEADGPPYASFGGFYSSNDSGNSFTELNHAGNNYFGYSTTGQDSSGQAPRDMDIAVSPIDVNEVHIAGILTWRSLDGGISFTCTSDWIPDDAAAANIGYCHADVDIMKFNGAALLVGTDGGIFLANSGDIIDANFYTDITTGLGIRQFYKIGISQTANVMVSGGSQDNGTSFYTAANGWKDWIGADGMETFIDKNTTNTMYGTYQYGQLFRTEDGASSLIDIIEPGTGQGNWVTPFEQDPSVTNTIYLGYNMVFKSLNSGVNWTSISQTFGNLNHLKIAPSNNQVMYAARTSLMYKTTDDGTTNWSQITSPGGEINSIAIHPANPNLAAVATTSANKVYVTTDGGTTWTNYLFNLPSFSALSVVWDDNGADALYVGMNYGLFYIDNTFSEWQPYNNNLPNVIVNELEINSVDGKVYAGTYGRGLWASPKGTPSLGTQDFLSETNITLYPNPANKTVTINLQKNIESDIRIFDMLGKLVIYQSDVFISKEQTIDISKLNNGIYFIRINSMKGSVTKKFIKE